MNYKTLGLFVPPVLAIAACAAPSVVSQNADQEAAKLHNIGSGYAVSVQDGSEYSLAFGGTTVGKGLTAKAAAATTATTPSYNKANGFILLLTAKSPQPSGAPSPSFAAGRQVWLLSKGSVGYLLNAASGLASGAPEASEQANYDAIFTPNQLAVKLPANLPAATYALVVTEAGDDETAAKANANTAAQFTVSETQFASPSPATSMWFNPIASASPAATL